MAAQPRRDSTRRIVIRVVIGLLILAGVVITSRWYLTNRSLTWQVRSGLQQLRRANDTATVRAALDGWERRLRESWGQRREQLVAYLCERADFADWRERALLTRLTAADYADRAADWKRWWATRQRRQTGKARSVPRRERVELTPRWQAPVGMTAWYTTILPLDGEIFVASLGTTFGDERDPADGVVRVDGRTGDAVLAYSPPMRAGRGPRDIIGIATGTDTLFVACYNGQVYSVQRDGTAVWETHAGSPIVAAPLGVDINQDGVCDVVVATSAAKAVAISGRNGNTVWVADIVAAPGSADLLGTTLALGGLRADDPTDILVTTPVGDVSVLAARDGDVRWHDVVPAGSIGGGAVAADSEGAVRAALVDRRANAWVLRPDADRLAAELWAWPALRNDLTIVAAPRIGNDADDGPIVHLALTGRAAAAGTSVCQIVAGRLQWRTPIQGRIWAAPAIADLNGDHVAEVLVAAIEEDANGAARGRLTVLSADGHVVHELTFDAPLECPPVVADVDGDQQLEVLVADQAGVLHCFATGAFGPVHWGLANGDTRNTRNARTAYAFGQTPFGFQWDWKPE